MMAVEKTIAGRQEQPNVVKDSLLPVCGAILCGGRSERMGRPKAFLPFAGTTMIEHRYQSLRELFADVLLVANDPEQYNHITDDIVKDIIPWRGPLIGILSVLLVSQHEHTFVIACDMPLVDNELILSMTSKRDGCDVLVAAHEEGVEPLLGIYSKRCIQPLEEAVFAGNLKVSDFLSGINAKLHYVSSLNGRGNLPSHFNVNTPQDYSKLVRS